MLRLSCKGWANSNLTFFGPVSFGAPNWSSININIFLHLSLFIIWFSVCPALKQEEEEKTEGTSELFRGIVSNIKSINKIDWTGKNESEMKEAWKQGVSHWENVPLKCWLNAPALFAIGPVCPISTTGFLHCLRLIALLSAFPLLPHSEPWDSFI